MATITPVITRLMPNNFYVGDSVFWETMTTTNDTGLPYAKPQFSDRSIQVTGTFGAAGNLRVQGSNDGTNWATLTDPQGNALDITSAKIEQISEVTQYIRPFVSGGDGTTDLDVTILAVRKF